MVKKAMYGNRKGVLLRVDAGLYGDLVRLYRLEIKGIRNKRDRHISGRMSFNRYLEGILERYLDSQRDLLRVYEELVKEDF